MKYTLEIFENPHTRKWVFTILREIDGAGIREKHEDFNTAKKLFLEHLGRSLQQHEIDKLQ